MAESIVSINEGTGKKLHTFQRTIGANDVQDEVILHGEPYLPGYTASAAAVSAATAASHTFQIMAGATNKVRIRRVEVYQFAAATAAAIIDIAVIRLSTAGTGGTVITPSPLEETDGASGATCMTLPTVKGTETTIVHRATAWLMQTITATPQFSAPILVIDFDKLRTKPIVIPAGVTKGICLKNITGAAAATLSFTVWFDETSF